MTDHLCASGSRLHISLGAMFLAACFGVTAFSSNAALAQSVGLPAPRLLTTMPMGGKAGSEIEATISGENLDEADELVFSDPRIKPSRRLAAAANPEQKK